MRFVKDTLTVLSGDLIVGITTFTLNIILSRTLGVTKFGLFVTIISIFLFSVGIADFGLGTSLVRFTSLYHRDETIVANLAATIFRFMIIGSIIVAIVLFLASDSIAFYLFGSKESSGLIKLVSIGVVVTAATKAVLSILQSRESFKKYALINVITAASRFSIVLGLLIVNLINVFTAVLAIVLSSFFALIYGSVIIRKFLNRPHEELHVPRHLFSNFINFNKWVVISFLIISVIARIDVFLLAHFTNSHTVGLYAAALQLCTAVTTLVGSVVSVLLPKVTKMTHKEQYINFIKKSLSFSLIAVILASPLLIFSKTIIVNIYGAAYLNSIGLFQILLFTYLLLPLFQPTALIYYAIGKPYILTITQMTQLVIGIISNIILIPIYGSYGVAYTWLTINLVSTVFLISYIIITISRSQAVVIGEELQLNVQ